MYRTFLHFWPFEDYLELADRPTGCGGFLFMWNFSVTSSTVLVEVERRH